ncbi:hypothetical protein ABN09_14605, partial [Morganella morganii]
PDDVFARRLALSDTEEEDIPRLTPFSATFVSRFVTRQRVTAVKSVPVSAGKNNTRTDSRKGKSE